jgi:16S rRNA (cytosine1402-N4)-methyltransferase
VTSVNPTHFPVLLNETVDALVQRPGLYVDGTFGGGGHTQAILERDPANRVIAFDLDAAAIERGRALARSVGEDRLTLFQDSFAALGDRLGDLGFGRVDGVLLDLGMSSYQVDDPERGFAFRFDGPLDMRFDQTRGETVADLIANADESELADIIWRYGEERKSRHIARAIVNERQRSPIQSTRRLAEVVAGVVGRKPGGIHPATRTFQALRIAVNDEIGALERGLDAAVDRLAEGGRLVVISFHSLEDRTVKQYIARASATCVCPPEQMICTCGATPTLRRIGSKTKPGAQELAANPRSRSAIMRVAERVGQP